ncbi:MAG TPA: NADP(H)-dependent aldo-keto reductase [Mariprofundaceae bacterium]|nr:NADP(H)-dependent aldo-keto reductase [Mariprofundaceae bacterium]
MEFRHLGNSDIKVSAICLGTMTWGKQNSQAEAFEQIDYALDQDINFIDTAELYAVPPEAETYGATETIIGSWLKQSGRRDEIVLASKVCGPTDWCPHIREGKSRLDRNNIFAAVEASLKRLQTDYLDLYQVHWPDRNTNYFGKLGYEVTDEESAVPIEETLAALGELITQGKVRHIGISNETPWGTMRYLQASESIGLPRIVSIQNPYNLLNRSFEVGLAEISHREEIGLLAYSPLAFGTLTGKYMGGHMPAGSRLSLFSDRYSRYSNPEGINATQKYVELAQESGMAPAQMALAFVNSRPFVAANIIGATTMEQLKENIGSINVTLSDELLANINAIHTAQPNPCP